MNRRMLIAGNWKMNLLMHDAVTLAAEIATAACANVDVAVAPPYPWLIPVKNVLTDTGMLLGAQNCHWEKYGAFTGEVSAEMLAGTCDFVIAGHSERRHVFKETDDDIARKVSSILDAGLGVVLCVGETVEERRSGSAVGVVTAQLESGLDSVRRDSVSSVTIAYEPVWAIGTGVAATSDDAQEMCAVIRSWLSTRFHGADTSVRILYGGSINPANAADLLAQPDIDGGLIGGASLKAEGFLEIVAAAESASKM